MPEKSGAGSMRGGFFAAAFFNAAILLVCFVIVPLGLSVVEFLGIAQLLWLVPLWRGYRKKGKTEDAKGVVLVAGITILLNAACWGSIKTYGISG